MPSAGYLVALVAVAGAITLALRALPFVLVSRLRSSALVAHLARHLPAGIMVILVLYLLRDLPAAGILVAARELAAVAVTVAVHLWRRQALLSIAAGTVTYAVGLALLPS